MLNEEKQVIDTICQLINVDKSIEKMIKGSMEKTGVESFLSEVDALKIDDTTTQKLIAVKTIMDYQIQEGLK